VNTVPTKPSTPLIRVHGLTKAFKKQVAVNNLTLNIFPGEIYALLGDNGAGKTTTINMLTTLLSPTAGNFHICGHDGVKEPEKVKQYFGFVSQDLAIYQELTAYENLLFIADINAISRNESLPRINQLLKQTGLEDRANDLSGQFSMGMQRKLSIAMALLHKPRVMFMDEPTVGLDPLARRHVWEALVELRSQNVAVLFTTHYLEEAELLADRVGILHLGKLIVEGTISELKSKIKPMQGIEILLATNYSKESISEKLSHLQAKGFGTPDYDPICKRLVVPTGSNKELSEDFIQIIDWLKKEELAYSKIATSGPRLDEVFMAVSSES